MKFTCQRDTILKEIEHANNFTSQRNALSISSNVLLENYQNFEINVVRNERGLKIELINPPESSIVDGEIVTMLQKHLFSVLRDIVLTNVAQKELLKLSADKLSNAQSITNWIFLILRNAGALLADTTPNIAVCWGGHSISTEEYNYAYKVGKELRNESR